MGNTAVPQQKRAEDERRQRGHLHQGGHFAHGGPDARPQHVGARQNDDGGDRNGLYGRRVGRRAQQVEQEFREDGGKRRHCGGCRDQDIQPAEYERGGIAISLAQEHVDAARLRQERAQLRHRERSANADQPERRPQSHDDERIRDEPGDRGGCAEDPAADRDADDQRRSADEPDDSAETSQANRRQTGLGTVIRCGDGVNRPVSGSRPNTTTESER